MSIYSDSAYMKRNADTQCKLVYFTSEYSYIASHPIFISIGLTAQISYLFRERITLFVLHSGRRLESGRRPWFMRSVSPRSLHTRMSLQGINTSAQVSE